MIIRILMREDNREPPHSRFIAWVKGEDPNEGFCGCSPDEALGHLVRERLNSYDSVTITSFDHVEDQETTDETRIPP